MSAKASQKEQMLFYQLDRKIINLPNISNAFNKSGKLSKRDSSPVTTILNYRCKGAAMWGVRAKGNLNQRQ